MCLLYEIDVYIQKWEKCAFKKRLIDWLSKTMSVFCSCIAAVIAATMLTMDLSSRLVAATYTAQCGFSQLALNKTQKLRAQLALKGIVARLNVNSSMRTGLPLGPGCSPPLPTQFNFTPTFLSKNKSIPGVPDVGIRPQGLEIIRAGNVSEGVGK